jgi:hypothetical protein
MIMTEINEGRLAVFYFISLICIGLGAVFWAGIKLEAYLEKRKTLRRRVDK